ncbi:MULTISPECIES: DUF488 family protein [Rossellomorea]|uniref:DUF488 domain-containing protein n=1 Tax=Rossellomorea TaxID=2837508 RepID=UPI001CCBC702|nr:MULTISPECIES: DUF488 family protein [Rossellomorea]MCA0149380.1 DUF488 family protein [Rossellomorea vietnamensis]WGG46811.1 DUF488 family protein [Rossellomorea sp. DA94]
MSIILKRIYKEPPRLRGHRILIDRVWPRGISKEEADLEEWMKEITPSPSLRKWFNHDPEKFEKFKQAYKDELHQDEVKQKKLRELKEMAENERLVLLYGAKDEKHNHAVVLKEVLEDM